MHLSISDQEYTALIKHLAGQQAEENPTRGKVAGRGSRQLDLFGLVAV